MVQKVVDLREEVKKLRNQEPQLRATNIAKILGRSRERIRQILIQLDLPTKIESSLERKVCIQCGAQSSQYYKLCRACFIKNGRIIVYCTFCQSPINRRRSWVRRSNKSDRYTGKVFCNVDHYYKYIISLEIKTKAKENDIVVLLKRPHKNHKATVLKSISQLKRGRIYLLECECGEQMKKEAIGFSTLKEKDECSEVPRV